MSCMIDVGDAAPDFRLPATDDREICLAEEIGKHRAIVIAFYVLDFTPG